MALVVLLQTDEGQAILCDRFSPGFDERRKSRAAQVLGKTNEEEEEDLDEDQVDETLMEVVDDDAEELSGVQPKSVFITTRPNIRYVCAQIRLHDLSFLFVDVFPNLPNIHIMECLKTIWKMTYRLGDNYDIHLRLGTLFNPPFRVHRANEEPLQYYPMHLLIRTFCVPTEELDVNPLAKGSCGVPEVSC